MNVFYLHGFASSARSSKATTFASRFRELGIELHTPDLNEPDFSTLTITRMATQVAAAIDALPRQPVVLIGSSLGGFLAVQVALQRPEQVSQLVLLAPALDFGGNRMRSLGGVGLEEWKRTNRLDVFHYGYGRIVPVHYELYADARRHDCVDAALSMPIQIFQGGGTMRWIRRAWNDGRRRGRTSSCTCSTTTTSSPPASDTSGRR